MAKADKPAKAKKAKTAGTGNESDTLPDGGSLSDTVSRLNERWGRNNKAGAQQGEGAEPKEGDVVFTHPEGDGEGVDDEPLISSIEDADENPDLIETDDAGEDDDTLSDSDLTKLVEDGKVEQANDEAEEDAPDLVPERDTVQRSAITIPKKNCMRCLHLMPQHPEAKDRWVTQKMKFKEAVPASGKGTNRKKATTKVVTREVTVRRAANAHAFPCFTEIDCPARAFSLQFNPFNDAKLNAAVAEFMRTGDVNVLSALYQQAEEISLELQEQIHGDVMKRMAVMAGAANMAATESAEISA